MNKPLKLGILGGLGPMASAYFYEMITEHTKAERDQDHIDILLSSRASTPDRTDYIMGRSDESPLPIMIKDAKYLESCKVSAIVIPCNTAHYFIDEIRRRKDADLERAFEKVRNKYGHDKICRLVVKMDEQLTDFNPKDDHVIHPESWF